MAGLALLAVSGAANLHADVRVFASRCSPGVVRACASLQVYTSGNNSGGTKVTILVRNLQGWTGGRDSTRGALRSRIELTAPVPLTGAADLTVASVGAEVVRSAAGWVPARSGARGGTIELTAGLLPARGRSGSATGGIAGCDAPLNGLPAAYYRTCDGGWASFSFTTTNAWSADDAEVAWSTRISANTDDPQGLECGTEDSDARSACPAVVPEPVTIILLGSGLAGLSGMGILRRRRDRTLDA